MQSVHSSSNPKDILYKNVFSHPRTVRKKKLIYVNVCFTELKMFKLSLSRNPSVHSRLPSVVLSQKNNATLNYHFHVAPQSLTNGSLFIKEWIILQPREACTKRSFSLETVRAAGVRRDRFDHPQHQRYNNVASLYYGSDEQLQRSHLELSIQECLDIVLVLNKLTF